MAHGRGGGWELFRRKYHKGKLCQGLCIEETVGIGGGGFQSVCQITVLLGTILGLEVE